MSLSRRSLFLAIVMVAAGGLAGLGTATVASGSASVIDGRIQTPGNLHFAGETKAHGDADLLHLDAPESASTKVRLSADHVRMDFTWMRGYRVDPGEPLSSNYVITDEGNETEDHASVDVTVETLDAPLELLAIAEESSAEIEARGDGTVTGQVTPPGRLVSVGESDQSESATEARRVGFTHSLDDAVPALSGLDLASVEGNFTLFVHNVSLEGSAGSEDFSHWTGYRANRAGPGTTEFHRRVTVLEVSGGALSIETSSDVDALGSDLAAQVNGTVASEDGARGRLVSETTAYLYESTQVEMQGEGTLELAASATVADARAVNPNSLAATVHGSFDVSSTPGILETARTEVAEKERGLPWAAVGSLVALPLLGAAVLVARRRGGQTVGHPGTGGPILAGSVPTGVDDEPREALDEELEEAREAFREQEFRRAARRAQKLARSHPEHPGPWDVLGRALMELGEAEAAREAFRNYDDAMEETEPDALVGLARACRASGDVEGTGSALVRLSQASPRQAAVLLGRPAFSQAGFSALEDLHVDAVEAWVGDLFDGGRWDEARRLGQALARRRPDTLLRLAQSGIASGVCRHGIEEVGTEVLCSLVEIAWTNDQLDLASDAFLVLARTDPGAARDLARQPGYRPLADDVRVQDLLSLEDEAETGPEGVSR